MTVRHVSLMEFIKRPIGSSLRCMREKAGLSQSCVARRARMRPEVLCRLEQGKGNPTVGTLRKILIAIEKE